MKQIQCDVPTVFLALFLSRRVHLTLLPSVKGSNLSLFYYQSRFARTSEKKGRKTPTVNARLQTQPFYFTLQSMLSVCSQSNE